MPIVKISTGDKGAIVSFDSDDAMEPCQITSVEGDLALSDIQAFFWLATLTAEGTAQGVCEMPDHQCSPVQFLIVMKMSGVEVDYVPTEWISTMEAMQSDYEARLLDGDVC